MAKLPRPTIHLVAGSTGAGKTTYAIALADRERALRFSIDDWTSSLFWPDAPHPITYDWAMERIGRCEAMIWSLVLQAADHGLGAVLDLGFTRAEHRRKFADLAAAAGLPVFLHVLDVPAEERWARVEARNAEQGETFRMAVDRTMFDFVEGLWEPPDAAEMAALNGVRVG
jgi:predicted kinase